MKQAHENIFGSRILQLRRKNHMTQAKFAASLFVTASTVSQWEGGRNMPSCDVVKLICKTFDVSADWLLGINLKGSGKDCRYIK